MNAGISPDQSRFLKTVDEAGDCRIVDRQYLAQFAHGPAILLLQKEQDAGLGGSHLDILLDHHFFQVGAEFLLGSKDKINESIVRGHLDNLDGMSPSGYLFGIPNNKCQSKIFRDMAKR
jgi:hypothetical protein